MRLGTRLDSCNAGALPTVPKHAFQGGQERGCRSGTECKYHVVIRSEYPQNTLQKMVSMFVGTPVHSELLLHEPGTTSQHCTYTAFMGETFSVSILTDQLIACEGFVNLGLQVTEEELRALQRFAMRLVERGVEYNYKDLPLAAGMVQSRVVLDTMFPDILDNTADAVQAVYCSQAIVLALRACLQEAHHPELCKVLAQMNSRAVSPMQLHETMAPFCRLVDSQSLRTDTITYLAPQGPNQQWKPNE